MMQFPKDWRNRDQNHVIHPLHNATIQKDAHLWVRGEGALLFDADGKEYIDAISGLWNVALGHGRTELADAAATQMQQLAYCTGYAGSANWQAIELAERLSRLCYPAINRFFFTCGGAEANDAAFKTARYYWKCKGRPTKTKIISRRWGYHGVTLASMSATGISSYWPMFEPRVEGFVHIDSPYPYRFPTPADGVSPGVAAANQLEEAILREGPETVAAFLAEPVQGAAGVIVPPDDYFPRIRTICDRYDVLLAADEVITGFGRTGQMFGLEHWGVEPDLIQFAKAITSGYFPLGGVGFHDRISEVFDEPERTWMHAYTYSGHPVGCAVANRALRILEDEQLVPRAAKLGRILLQDLQETLGDLPVVGEVRGLGLMCGVELVADRESKAEFPKEQAVGARAHKEAQKRGLFTRMRGDVFCIAPPLTTPEPLLRRIPQILREAIQATMSEA